MKKGSRDSRVLAIQDWFSKSVTYEGEQYAVDYEQAAAIADTSFNTIVVARAGSGKTRTLVAKIVYLVSQCGVKPDEIMAFVFNANAAKEINERLGKMCVNGQSVFGDGVMSTDEGRKSQVLPSNVDSVESESCRGGDYIRIASTFHAFARKVVYKVCRGEKKCGKILAGEKDAFILEIVKKMLHESVWWQRIMWFVKGENCFDRADNLEAERYSDLTKGLSTKDYFDPAGERGQVVKTKDFINDEELKRFAAMMSQFVNRAQQKYLGGELSVGDVAREYISRNDVSAREKVFIELGVEVFRRYHWYLLSSKEGLPGFTEQGTDFNLVVSWASKLIASGRPEIIKLLKDKKYILVDEYQDFSQLFLASVEAIRSVATDARLFVVGDDWQAINRFAGSDVEYFKQFEKYFGEVKSKSSEVQPYAKYEITTNYRCDFEVVDAARRFIKKSMGEKGNFRAFSRDPGLVYLVEPKNTSLNYAYMDYDMRASAEDKLFKKGAWRLKKKVPDMKTVRYLKTVANVIADCRAAKKILLLHRNNEMNVGGASLEAFSDALRWCLDHSGILPESEYDEKVCIMTMHRSKGLEAEAVIILEAEDGIIPKMHPDTLLYGMFGETEEVALDDQKRLFYVAMTRAKKRLYIISDGSGFVKYLGRGLEKWGE